MHARLALAPLELRSPQGWLAIAPALALACLALPLRYHVTLSEPDLARMMSAFVYGSANGLGLNAGMHYGEAFSFGYYRLFYALAPASWLRDPDRVAILMNGFGVLAGLWCAWAMTGYLRRIFGTTVALPAATLALLSPGMLPLAFSGHPLVPAAACLFCAGWLLAKESAPWRQAAAFALLVLGLSFRAEIALAFPFVWLGGGRRGRWAHGGILIGAFAAFLLLQQPYVRTEGGTISRLHTFVTDFMSLGRIGSGLAVLGLASGVVTLGVAAWSIAVGGKDRRPFALAALLAAPSLATWLPNAFPARHMFFPVLGLALLAAVALAERHGFAPARLLAITIALVAGNQLAAEALHPLIAARYPWSYEALGGRRASQQAPVGAFFLDQPANQLRAGVEREEAIELARQAPERLLVLADAQEYLIAHFLAADRNLAWREYRWHGVFATELKSGRREIVMLDKASAWPRDVAAEALADPDWRTWPVYVQPSTVTAYDRTQVPVARRFPFH